MLKRTTILLIILLITSIGFAIPPYLYFGQLQSNQNNAVMKSISDNGFDIIGSYNPMGNTDITVIAFTNQQLIEITSKVKDRGALAAVLKVAIINEDGKPNVYLLNPEYIFWAYLRNEMKKSSLSDPLMSIDTKIKNTLELLGTSPIETGGNITRSDLVKYRYMLGMERFSNPVELNTYTSFEEGLKIISSNAEQGKENTKLVYKIVDIENKTAVLGIGLLDKDKGEPNFLPIIGIDNAAALPYEIILQDTEVSMLHGRYRLALHWPELTMMTFSKIMSTPGEIEDQLKALTEKLK